MKKIYGDKKLILRNEYLLLLIQFIFDFEGNLDRYLYKYYPQINIIINQIKLIFLYFQAFWSICENH